MFLKDHFKEIFNKASLENNILVKEDIIIKWVHRFGFDSLNDLLLQSPLTKEENKEQISLIEEKYEEEKYEEEKYEEENKEQISLVEEKYEKENEQEIKFKLLETSKNQEETNCKSNDEKNHTNDKYENKTYENAKNNKNNYIRANKLPLPHINDLRKWINNEKKAS